VKPHKGMSTLVRVVTILALGGCSSSGPGRLDQDPAELSAGKARTWNFDQDAPDVLPQSWKGAETHGHSQEGAWQVVEDGASKSKPNILKLVTRNSGGTYNLCVLKHVRAGDLDLSVALRADAGREDQGGGLLWRYHDANNYYVARVNPLEDNFRLYKVENGKRSQLHSASSNVRQGQWTTMRIVHVGDRIDCYLDGKLLIAGHDNTFGESGQIGLWTKADASTSFDNVKLIAKGTE